MSVSSASDLQMRRSASISCRPAGWHPDALPLRLLTCIICGVFGALMVAGLVGYGRVPHPANDFFAFDSYGRFIHRFQPALIYDQDLLRRFQALPGHKVFAFMYPPPMLLLVWPLGLTPYAVGYVAWIGLGVVGCAVILGARRASWPLVVLAVLAPSTLWTTLCGQSSLIVAGLITGGLLLSERRPWLGGVLLGIATYKPQLGLLVPIALIAAGQWRTIASAALTFVTLAVATTMAFGSDIWIAWLSHLTSIVDVRTRHAVTWAPLLSTVSSDLASLGVGRRAADLMQALSAIAASGLIWSVCRAKSDQGDRSRVRLRVAALAAATFLATPFAFIYDLPLLTMAVLLFADERCRASESFSSADILAMAAGLLAPMIFLIGDLHWAGSLAVLAMLTMIVRRYHLVAPTGSTASDGPMLTAE